VDKINLEAIIELISTRGVDLALNLLGAIVIWIVGRWIIGKVMKLLTKTINHGGKLDKTITRYIVSIVSFLLTVLLIMFILSRFGIETTSFAALLAGAGLAIGTENVKTMISNDKIFSSVIENFTYNPYRRVDCEVKINHSVDVADALAKLKTAIAGVDNIMDTPAPDIEVLKLTYEGPVICVRPYCNNKHYWQVLFDTNKTVLETVAANKWPAPAVHEVHLQG